MFALDSVPAIFALTREPFIVFTSNVFAILGLRSLYFLLGDAVERFHLLRYGLAVILVFVGLKMVVARRLVWRQVPDRPVAGHHRRRAGGVDRTIDGDVPARREPQARVGSGEA